MAVNTIGKKLTKYFEFKSWMGGVFVFLVVFLFFAIKAPGFFTPINLLRNWLMPAGIAAVVSLGMTIVMAGGGIDLSVGANAGLSALFAASLTSVFHLGIIPMILCALLIGTAIGAINGAFIAYLGVNPFVVTLSVVFLIRGLQYLVTLAAVNGTYIMLPFSVMNLGSNSIFQIGAFIVAALLLYVFLDKTRFGRYIRAVGDNLEVAKYSGVSYRFYTWLTYALCGTLVALGGFMLTSYEGVIRVGSGEGYLIDAFVLPILGQAIFRRISVEGTIFGSLFIYMIINGFFIFGTPPVYVNLIKGGLLLLMLIISGIQKFKES